MAAAQSWRVETDSRYIHTQVINPDQSPGNDP